jgi:hypothetical protein
MNKLLITVALTAALATPGFSAFARGEEAPAPQQVRSLPAPQERSMQSRYARSEHQSYPWQSCPDPDHIWDARCY